METFDPRSQATGDGHDDERLRIALRALRGEQPPSRDLWPQVAARIAATPTRATRRRPDWRAAPLALVATLLLGLGLAWQLWPPPQPARPMDSALVGREANAMTREYAAALREIQLASPQPEAARLANVPALRELDRSAAQIRTALRRDPGARYLLERLQHTYGLRLSLTQRAAVG